MGINISRRDFLKYCIGSAAVLGLGEAIVSKLEKAYAQQTAVPTVIWIEGSSCSGCSVSLANLIGNCADGGPVDLYDFINNYTRVPFAKTFMSAAGDMAVSSLRSSQQGAYILVVEGGIPTAFNGMACTVFSENGADVTIQALVTQLASKATAVVCVGSCSSYGGIPAAGSNPMGVKSVSELTGIRTINLPGCPVHPDWLAATVASVVCGTIPALDANGRPKSIYSTTVHDSCPRSPYYKNGSFAKTFGEEGRCLYKMGCNGPTTTADCPNRGWNNGFNYCMQSNGNCLGCVEKDFPKAQLVYRGNRV